MKDTGSDNDFDEHGSLNFDKNFSIGRAPLVAQLVKNLPAVRETWVQSLGWEDPLEIPTPVFWPGEFYGQSMWLQRVGHD